MGNYRHTALEYGEKYGLILASQTNFIDKYSCPSSHLFLTNVIVCVRFGEIYFEQISPCPVLEWCSTIFLTFHRQLKISGTIFMAPPCNLSAFSVILATFWWNIKLRISSIRWKRGQGGMKALFKGTNFLGQGYIHKLRSHNMLQYHLLIFCCGVELWEFLFGTFHHLPQPTFLKINL